jgi:MFS family permease
MREVLAVLRVERTARWFLFATAQSAVGTGAAAIGLVVLAYDRLASPWSIALVLLADFLPVMLLGPFFGAIADRWSRRACAVAGEVMGAAAFIGIGLVDSYEATVALALLAGAGQALFFPAVLAALPSLVAEERHAAVTSLFGAMRDVGRTIGPLVAAGLLSIAPAADLMFVNGLTFAVSAVVIALVPFDARLRADADEPRGRILQEVREGLTLTWEMVGVRTVLWSSTFVAVFAAMLNVGELLLARDLGANASQFALLMVAVGFGVVLGSLSGGRGGELPVLKSRYLGGIALIAIATGALAVVDSFGAALVAFFGTGVGNGLIVVHERLIFHAAVPDRLMARAFALLDTLAGWGFAAAFIGAGAIISALGIRPVFAIAGAAGLVVWLAAAVALRNVWRPVAAVAD